MCFLDSINYEIFLKKSDDKWHFDWLIDWIDFLYNRIRNMMCFSFSEKNIRNVFKKMFPELFLKVCVKKKILYRWNE